MAFMKTSDRIAALGRIRLRLSNERQLIELPGRDVNERSSLFKDFLASIAATHAEASPAASSPQNHLSAACASVVGDLISQSDFLYYNRHIPTLVAAYVCVKTLSCCAPPTLMRGPSVTDGSRVHSPFALRNPTSILSQCARPLSGCRETCRYV